jgi:hypothetical protein
MKEELFPGGEDEISPAVDTLQHLVLKFHLRMAPFSPFSPPLAGKRWHGETQVVYIPPRTTPWTRPATHLGRCADTAFRA